MMLLSWKMMTRMREKIRVIKSTKVITKVIMMMAMMITTRK